MEKVLSIVVPAYNVEKYLEECLHSLEIESILDKIEVLVINDGSKDGTKQIAQVFCDKYPETYFLYDKENGGHGSGINYGIRYASGTYFKVLDGDDWFDGQELQRFVDMLEHQQADIVASDFMCVQDGTYKVLDKRPCTNDESQYGNIYEFSGGEIGEVIKMHAFTVKTAILQENQIHIDEKCYYVDCEYTAYPIAYAKTVYFYRGYLYRYRLGRNGQSVDIKSMQKNRRQHERVLKSLLDFYGKNGQLDIKTREYLAKLIALVVENQFQIYISMGLKQGIYRELKEWDRGLKKDYPDIYHATNKKSIDLLRKTNYVMLPIGTLVYKVVK